MGVILIYSIGEVARLTGITAYTLRYYEKIGLLPQPSRHNGKENGIRTYSDEDLRFIRFLHGLKQTGMKLENIAAFVEDGCLLSQLDDRPDATPILHKRIDILDEHIKQLEKQIDQLKAIKATACEKRDFYGTLLKSEKSSIDHLLGS